MAEENQPVDRHSCHYGIACTSDTAFTNDTAATTNTAVNSTSGTDGIFSLATEQGPLPDLSNLEDLVGHCPSGLTHVLPVTSAVGTSNRQREPEVALNRGQKRRHAISEETQEQRPARRPRRSPRLTRQDRR